MDCNVKDIWQSFSDRLLSYIKLKVHDEYIAEDLLQEVFLKLYKHIDKLEEVSELKPWLYKITSNTIIDYYRKHNEDPIMDEFLEKELKANEEAVNMNDEIGQCLKSLIFKLPNKYQTSLLLYDLEGLKHKEIARKLNISISCSKTRVQRARNKLKEILFDCCDIQSDLFGNILEYQLKKNYNCLKNEC
ncbi:RNA polymerase sigma factor SigZ [Desulfitobacterium sp. AusDCA]|uniref:RNA polymerase sigma factor SigZ n=1 Tax=Desulfitobacterium sp. AusDCA TaxID=3240383 RepID=UPI003DA744A3